MPDRPAAVSRRAFLGRTAQNAAGLAAGLVGIGAGVQAAMSPGEPVRVGVIGCGRQGRKLAAEFAAQSDATVAALCDVDAAMLTQTVASLAGAKPRTERDFRRLLDDPTLHAVVVATPDHSHAAIALAALQAGKDVYLESPACHRRGETSPLLAAGQGRVVQVGLQDRSLPHVRDAIAFLHAGRLGRVPLVKAWAVQKRPALPSGDGKPVVAPSGVDYAGWLFPTPERPFDPRRFHRGWSGFWEYGSGELGTSGVGLLDLARWGLGVDLPMRTTASGLNVADRAAETPDTLQVTFAYPETTLLWEHRRWSNHAPEGRSAGVAFHGERGTLVLDRGGWKVYDAAEPAGGDGRAGLTPHVRDFLAHVRDRSRPAAPLETGLTSAALCRLGNLSYRLGRELDGEASTDDAVT